MSWIFFFGLFFLILTTPAVQAFCSIYLDFLKFPWEFFHHAGYCLSPDHLSVLLEMKKFLVIDTLETSFPKLLVRILLS